MALSLWNAKKGYTYKSMDLWTAQQFRIGGTAAFVHKYIGPVTTNSDNEYIPDTAGQTNGELTIQDIFFMENRDRMYDQDIYELRVHYLLNDQDWDLSQFGFFLPNDIIFMTVHQNESVDIIGRRLMSGDVIELPHVRDDLLLDPLRPAVNKFFVITDINRAAEGYSPIWYPHILRMKLEPMTDSQEFNDILDREIEDGNELTLRDILSTYNDEIKISDRIEEIANENVPEYNFETAHFYYLPPADGGDCTGDPWIFAGDGEPPNGLVPLGSGNFFPIGASDGDYFLRTDYVPNVLFRREGNCWVRKEVDYRRKWKAAHRLLETFINNDNITRMPGGETFPEKQGISKAVTPKVDL